MHNNIGTRPITTSSLTDGYLLYAGRLDSNLQAHSFSAPKSPRISTDYHRVVSRPNLPWSDRLLASYQEAVFSMIQEQATIALSRNQL